MQRIMVWSSRHPIATLAVIGFISLAAFFPASRVRIETSTDSLMMENDPEKAYYLQTREMFGSEALSLVYIEDSQLFSPAKLDAMERLVGDLEAIEGIASSESLFSTTDISRSNGQIDIRPLIEWAPDTDGAANLLRKRVLEHPVIRRLLISEEADATVIQLRIGMDDGQADEIRRLSEDIERAMAPYSNAFSRLEQLGRPYVIERETACIMRDQRLILPLAVLVLAVMLVSILSSFKGALLPLLTSGVSILWTLAFMGLINLPVTELSFMVPSLIIAIGSTEDIHLLSEFRASRREQLDRKQAVNRMIVRLAAAVAFTAATTFCGFATIMATPIPVLRNFGLAASFGLLANPAVTITLIPACLTLMPDRGKRPCSHRLANRLEQLILNRLAVFRRRPRITLAAACIPCIILGIWGAFHVEADNNIIAFFKPDSPVVRRVDRLARNLSGSESFCIRLDAREQQAFKDPANLFYALRLQDYLADAGWIDRSISITDYLSYIHAAFQPGGERLPKTQEGIAEYLLLLHYTEIEPYATPDYQSLNIVVRHNIRSSKELAPRISALRDYIQRTCPEHLTPGVTGEMLLVNKAVHAIVRGQLRSVLIIAFIAAALMSLLFRSVRIGCLGLIPNLLPVGVQFGFMAIAGIPLNTATSMAAAISIGLAVDDTIHLLMRFYSHRNQVPTAQAVERSTRQLLRPVVATTISLSLGFLVMRFSSFTPIGDFALLSAIMLTTALLADLIVTPTLLSLDIMHAPRRKRSGSMETAS